MYLINKKFVFSLVLLFCLLYYLFFSIPANLNDDHGIIIIAGLQVSQGLFPGINFTYPHGVIPPIILGLFFKIFQYFNISWQIPYFVISSLLFLFFVYILVKLINNIFEISNYHSSLISLLLVSFCLNPWGGIYFDYISINFCFTIIYLFFISFNSLEESNNFDRKNGLTFFILGSFVFINPFLIKLTSIYISLAITLCLIYLIFFNEKFSNFKYKICKYFFAGLLILPFLILLKYINNLNELNLIILNILDPVFNADDLARNYSLNRIPHKAFIFSIFSLFTLSTFLIIFNKKIYNNTFLIYKLLTFFFIFQYMQVWGRNRDWLIIVITFLCIKTLYDSKKLLINKSEKLLLSIIFSSLAFFNFLIFIKLKKEIIIRQKLLENNAFLNFKNTNLSFFKIRENAGWGLSNDVVEVGKILKSKLENKTIKNYSYFDDNAFLIPLITGIKPIQNYAFFQINKTIFKNKAPKINNFNLGKPDNLVICLPLKNKTFKSDPNLFIKNKLKYKHLFEKFPINNSERYLREKKLGKDFEDAKKIYLSFTDIYIRNYEVIFSNDSCIIYEPKNNPLY